MTTDELELAIRDSVQMEAAKTFSDLTYICRNIESRHRVEGITPSDLAAYENVKAQHVKRVTRGMRV
jgi:hypothetical protein